MPLAVALVALGLDSAMPLCGERHARTWTTAPPGAFASIGRSIKQLFGSAPIGDTLKDL